MARWLIAPVCVLVLLGGCSPKAGDAAGSGGPESYSVSADAGGAPAPKADGGAPAPVNIALPQLAYVYALGFRMPVDRIEATQRAHLALCDRLGPTRCQMVAVSLDGDGPAAGGAMKLRVATPIARAFSDALKKAAAEQGGREIDTKVEAEDVSKDIVDANARIAQRTLLVERLTEILRTREGKVGELVEAERSVAQAQEELDQARGWLAELQRRVATSTFDLTYSAVAPSAGGGGRLSFVEAVTGSVSTFVNGISVIGIALVFLAPWVLLFGAIAWGVRALARRMRARAVEVEDAVPATPPAPAAAPVE